MVISRAEFTNIAIIFVDYGYFIVIGNTLESPMHEFI